MKTLLMLAILISGCAPLATFQLSNDVEMEVYSMTADNSSYEVRVKFIEDTPFHDVVQEGRDISGLIFVEKFSADCRTKTDLHFSSGLSGEDIRTMVVYAGNTLNTGDRNGFAMLPFNMDRSVITNAGLGFNASYRKLFPVLTGEIVAQNNIRGQWILTWRPGSVTIQTSSGGITYQNGRITKQ